MIVGTAYVHLRSTRPSSQQPVELTLFKYPQDLFGMREDSPSLTLSLVCQRDIAILDIRFISTVEYAGFGERMGQAMDDPNDLLSDPPLSNLSAILAQYGAGPRILNEVIYLQGVKHVLCTYDFDASSGGIVGSGAFLVYEFLFNSSNHLVGCFRGMEDFFIMADDTLDYICVEARDNLTEYSREKRTDERPMTDRPRSGVIRLTDLAPGDTVSVTLRWRPNIKGATKEMRSNLSGARFIERIEVEADGRIVEVGIPTILIKNLG